MKSFARGSKKRLGGRGGVKKKKEESDDGGLSEMFGGRELSPLPHNRVAAGDSELQSDALEAGTGENTAFRLPYPREETRSLEQDTFGSFSPTGPSTMESGGKRPSSVASNGSPRRRSNVPPVRATGPRPPFGGLGFRFEQSSDEDKGKWVES